MYTVTWEPGYRFVHWAGIWIVMLHLRCQVSGTTLLCCRRLEFLVEPQNPDYECKDDDEEDRSNDGCGNPGF